MLGRDRKCSTDTGSEVRHVTIKACWLQLVTSLLFTEELSISISVSNSQIQENVVSHPVVRF